MTFSITSQSLHFMIQVIPDSKLWYFFAIYTSNDFQSRTKLWDELINLSKTYRGKWFEGDFNQILKSNENYGGRYIDNYRSYIFYQYMDQCNMVDLGYKMCKYTWTNKRYKNRQNRILERLDKCVVNDSWILRYPQVTFTHMPRTQFDHCTLQVSLWTQHANNQKNPFILEPMRCGHSTFKGLIQSCFN